jgi:hypothetical protein
MVNPSSTSNSKNGEVTNNHSILSIIQTAEKSPTIDGITYKAEAYLNRDFMPIVDPPVLLTASVDVQTTSQDPIPESLNVTQLYIVKGQQVWLPNEIEEHPSSEPWSKHVVARNGPQWQEGTQATVGVKLEDTIRDKVYYLKISDVSVTYSY